MKILQKEKYNLVTEELLKVKINNLFARSVIEGHVSGKVYVNNLENPKTFYVLHPYGISLLFGKCNNAEFNAIFKNYALNNKNERTKFEWLQTYPRNWDNIFNTLFSDRLVKETENIEKKEQGIIEVNTRLNFLFNRDKYLDFKKNNGITGLEIVATDKQSFEDMKGSVIPQYFWDNANDFNKKGKGFSLFYKGKLASTAYSAFVHENQLEIGIETLEEFRGMGFAQSVCSALIDYCLENNLEPVWSCKLENIGSVKLATKLGFEESLRLPFYRLSK